MKLTLKKTVDLTETDITTHPVWVSFYEPDEFDLLEQLGVARADAQAALEAVEYSDEYIFPLPATAAELPFNYLYLSVQAKTPADAILIGLRSSVSLSLLHRGKAYHFNKAALSLSEAQAKELAGVLGESDIFPLNIFIPALKRSENFTLANAG